MPITVYPDFEIVKTKIELSLRILNKNDLFLITNTVAERSITHKLAEYIQQQFPDWHVDCEYNRKEMDNSKSTQSQDITYPDIIIHHRNTKDNLLVIELKNDLIPKSDSNKKEEEKHDKEKLFSYVKKNIEDRFNYSYRYGLWILHKDSMTKSKLDWYKHYKGNCIKVNL